MTTFTLEATFDNAGPLYSGPITGTFDLEGANIISAALDFAGVGSFHTVQLGNNGQLSLLSDSGQYTLFFDITPDTVLLTHQVPPEGEFYGMDAGYVVYGVLNETGALGRTLAFGNTHGIVCGIDPCPVPAPEVGAGLLPALLLLVAFIARRRLDRHQPPRHLAHPGNA